MLAMHGLPQQQYSQHESFAQNRFGEYRKIRKIEGDF